MNENSNTEQMERRIHILDDDECKPCEQIKADLKDEIESGKVKVLQVTSDEALELLERAGAPDKVELPSALIEEGGEVRHCQLYHSKEVTLAACGDEIIVIREIEEPPPSPTD